MRSVNENLEIQEKMAGIVAVCDDGLWVPIITCEGPGTASGQRNTNSFLGDASFEVTALREENTKHYYVGDGVFRTISYSHPIHEIDDSGVWENMDFGLSLSERTDGSVYSSKTAGASFSAEYSGDQQLMTLAKEGCQNRVNEFRLFLETYYGD